MSFQSNDFWRLVKVQYIYKFRSNVNLFIGLILIQIVCFIATFLGIPSGGRGLGSDMFSLNYTIIGEFPFFLGNFIWLITFSIALSSKEQRNFDFVFPGNRWTSSLSSVLVMLTGIVYSLITYGFITQTSKIVTFYLSSSINKVIVLGSENIDRVTAKPQIYLEEVFLSMVLLALYSMLIASFVYLISMSVQAKKSLGIVFILAFIMLIYFEVQFRTNIIGSVFSFYTEDKNLGFYTLKYLATSAILFGMGSKIFSGIEVRQ